MKCSCFVQKNLKKVDKIDSPIIVVAAGGGLLLIYLIEMGHALMPDVVVGSCWGSSLQNC